MARRFDIAPLAKAEKLSNGMVRAEAYLTRTGVFLYKNPDGSERRELRRPEDVFHADSVKSFAHLPVTDDHPSEMLNAENARMYHKGNLGDALKQDGDKLRGSLLVHDETLIRKMDAGKTQVSLGYHCDIEETPGVWRGEKYDAIQTNIRGNHAAVVAVGRAGAQCAIRMDAGDAMMVDHGTGNAGAPIFLGDAGIVKPSEAPPPPGGSPTAGEEEIKTDLKIPGPTPPVGPGPGGLMMDGKFCAGPAGPMKGQKMDEQEVTIDGQVFKMNAETAKAVAKVQARADVAEKARMDAEDGDKFARRVSARVSLERVAASHLGEEARFDAKTDKEIKIEVLKKLGVEADPEWSADYLQARYDAQVDYAVSRAGEAALGDFRQAVVAAERTDANRVDSRAAYQNYRTKLHGLSALPDDAVTQGGK